MYSAQAYWPCFEKVQLPIKVICLLNKSLLTSILTSPPSPTKHAFPQVRRHLILWDLASGEDDGSIDGAKAEVGNPELKPMEATNYDIGLEYYLSYFSYVSFVVGLSGVCLC